MNLSAMGDARRAQSKFPAPDHGLGDGDGEEEVGFSDAVVIEEIGDVGSEVVSVESPSAKGDGDPELMFFVAFAVERDESADFGVAEIE